MKEQDYALICLGIQSYNMSRLGNYLSYGKEYKYFVGESVQLPWNNNYLFFISKGSFRITALNPDGEEYDIAYCYQNSILQANEHVMNSRCFEPSRMIAMENSILVCFLRDKFYEFIQTDHELFDNFVDNCSNYASLLKERLLITSNTSSSQRVLIWLEKLCMTQMPDEKGVFVLPCDLTQQQISNLLFIHITTCNKVFSRLSKEKIARYFRGRIEVYDLERLRMFRNLRMKLL